MKKILVFLLCIVSLFSIGIYNIYAEEGEETEETTEVEENVYGQETEDGTKIKFIFNKEEKTYVGIIITPDGEELTDTGVYEVIKNNVYLLYDSNNEARGKIKLNDDHTIEPYYDPCTVVIEANGYGEVMTDITSGEMGDICTIQASPSILCELVAITVNGTKIIANSNGLYQFALAEGENKVSAEFKISNEKIAEITSIMENVKNNGIDSLFTANNLIILIALVVEILLGSGFFITWIRSKRIKAKTAEDVTNVVKQVLTDENKEAFVQLVKTLIGPSFEAINLDISTIKETINKLVQCMILAQENTPESRLAIAKFLTTNDERINELAEKVKNIINDEIETNKKEQEETKEILADLKATNDSLVEEKTDLVIEEKNDVEGRY